MKVYLVGTPHLKNQESIRKTLTLFQIPYEEHSDLRALNDSFTLAMCFTTFYPPSAFPSTCKVIYGPHFFVVPDDMNHPLYKHTYDTSRFFFNTLSQWVNTLYREFCNLDLPFINAFFGIDTDTIKPISTDAERTHVLIYCKDTFTDRYEHAIQFCKTHNIPYHVIRYGSYKDADFKRCLQNSRFAIWIGRHESQGFALEETLATNIPILLWDVQTMYEEFSNGRVVYDTYKHRNYKMIATCAPYWSEQCGIRFFYKEDFAEAFERMMTSYTTFTPRDYVERHLSIPVAWHNLLQCIGEL